MSDSVKRYICVLFRAMNLTNLLFVKQKFTENSNAHVLDLCFIEIMLYFFVVIIFQPSFVYGRSIFAFDCWTQLGAIFVSFYVL